MPAPGADAGDSASAPVDLTAGAADGPVWGVASQEPNVTLLSWPPSTTEPLTAAAGAWWVTSGPRVAV